jgi:hypothetical protein
MGAADKGGTIYLIDRDHMGHYQPNDDSLAVQTMPSPGGRCLWLNGLLEPQPLRAEQQF